MKKESKRSIIRGIVGIIGICIVAFVLSFVADTHTIPVANEVSLAQVNGGDEEFVEMRTTNKVIESVQNVIWPIAYSLCFGIIGFVIGGTLRREGIVKSK